MYWPKFLVHKAKQRLTKMTQMRIRMRKLALKTREKIMTTPRKEMKRDARREEKAERAARVNENIEKELVKRLREGVYPIYNFSDKVFDDFLVEGKHVSDDEEEMEPEIEFVEDIDGLEEEDDMEDFGSFSLDKSLVNNDDASGEDEEMDKVDRKRANKRSKSAHEKMEKDESRKLKKKARVLVEVEREDTSERSKASF